MRRFLLAVVVIMGSLSALGAAHQNAQTASAHDVERDGLDCPSGVQCFPFIGFIQGAEAFGGSFSLTISAHGYVKGAWLCELGQIGTTQVYSNWNGTQPRVLSVTVPTINATLTGDADGTIEDHCWFRVLATSTPDNVFTAQPFALGLSRYWIDYGEGGEEPFPEPTPTPGPSPTPTPGAAGSYEVESTCQAGESGPTPYRGEVAGPAIQNGDRVEVDVYLNHAPGSTGRAFNWLTASATAGGVTLPSTNPTGGWQENDTSTTFPQGSTGLAGPPGVWTGPYQISARTHTMTDATTVWYCQNFDDASAPHGDTVRFVVRFVSGPTFDSIVPEPTPTPTPSPTPPEGPGVYQPFPGSGSGSGFDVCDPQYTASTKSMCDEFPPPDGGNEVDVCPEGSNLALCEEQMVYDFGDPAGNGDAVEGLLLEIRTKAPFAYAIQAGEALQAGIGAGAAGGAADWCFDMPRWVPGGASAVTSACLPMDEVAGWASPARAVFLALITVAWLAFLVKLLNRNAGAG